MALVTIPAHAFPLSSSLELEEARSEYTSEYNYKRIAVNFPGFRWRGVYSIGLMDGTSLPGEIDFQRGYAIEAAVRQITDPENSFECPVYRPAATLAGGAVISTVAGADITISGDPDAAALPGSLIRSGNRTWQVVAVSGGTWTLRSSLVMPEVGDAVSGTETVRARIAETARPPFPRNGSAIGPWVIAWVEAV